MEKQEKKTKSELWRDVLRLYAGAGLNAALTVAAGVIGVDQIKRGEHLTTALLVMGGVFFADRMYTKAKAGKVAWQQIQKQR